MWKFLLTALFVAALASPLLAQDPPDGDKDEDLIQITPKEDGWDVIDLFRTISEYTGKSIVYDPNQPQIRGKKIKFEGTHTVPRDRLFDWFKSLLSFQRLVLVPLGPEGHLQYMALDVNAPQIMNRPIFVPEDEITDWADRDGVYIVSTITVRNLTDTSRARNALAQLSTRQIGRINDVPGNLAFVVGDFAPVVASMYRLLKAMDVTPIEYEQIGRTYTLTYAVASEVEPILSDLLQSAQAAPGGRRPTSQGVPTKPQPRLIADTRQDAIIVYAVPEDHLRIGELIQLLDQEVTYKRGNIHIRKIKHTDAAELADVLTELIRGTGLGTGTQPGRPGRPTAGALTGAQSEPVIVADDRTNSLLIQATATQLLDLEDIITQIDVPRDQVLVEAALIELTIDDLIRFGVELTSAVRRNDPRERTFFGRTGFGLTTLTDTDADGIPDINVPTFAAGGLTAGIFDNSRFPLVLQTLASNTRARAISMPSVVVEDGSRAIMTVRDSVPFSVTEDTDTGISRQRIEYTDADITLEISPHISSDNYLRLHIHQTVGSFRGQSDPTLPPPSTTREIETDIVVPDGYTVIMGGLINQNTSNSEEGIPYLQDIPLLGWFFRSRRSSSATTSLFLFVTPHILKGTERGFADYHRVSWEKKLLADRLLDQAVEIVGSRFKGQEDQEKMDELEQIQETGYLDKPRYKRPPTTEMTPAEARRRIEEVRAERAAAKEKFKRSKAMEERE